MLRNPKWWVGFVTSTLFSVWTVAFLLGLSNYLSMGDAFAVMYLTMGVFVLMVLLMLLWLFSKRMRPVSFGLAIPLLGCCV